MQKFYAARRCATTSFFTSSARLLSFFFLTALLLCQQAVKANTLNSGSIVIIGMNVYTDEIRMVPLVNIPAGTVIKITDRGWNQGTTSFSAFITGDGTITWTTTSSVAAGSVLRLVLGGSDNIPATSFTNLLTGGNLLGQISISGYTVTDPMPVSGDQFFIYQDADANPYFIFGINSSFGTVDAQNWNTSIGAVLRDSYLPNGVGSQNALTNGLNAIGLPGGTSQTDNMQYTGATSATGGSAWLSRFTNLVNWTGDNSLPGITVSPVGNSISMLSTLPVKLVFFTATQSNPDGILLRWKTAAPEDGCRYELQRSTGSSFSTIGTLDGDAVQTDFRFSDQWMTGNDQQQYRLKMTEANGYTSYSQQLLLSRNNFVTAGIKAFPNPFAGKINLQLDLPKAGTVRIQLHSITGMQLYQQQLQLEKGSSVLAIEPANSVAGAIYLLTVEYAGQRKLIRLSRQ
ncbi:MAG: hypothetical protein J0L56_11715 [Chitinophagales bacterium]|nr:hypothetical protein [Chitinophagales bacterium]